MSLIMTNEIHCISQQEIRSALPFFTLTKACITYYSYRHQKIPVNFVNGICHKKLLRGMMIMSVRMI